MTSEQFRAFTELLMVSDPWPLDEHASKVLNDYANEVSREMGFHDWIAAYHAL